jgi:hypothetical protein
VDAALYQVKECKFYTDGATTALQQRVRLHPPVTAIAAEPGGRFETMRTLARRDASRRAGGTAVQVADLAAGRGPDRASEQSRLHAYTVLCLLTGCGPRRPASCAGITWISMVIRMPTLPCHHLAVWRSVRPTVMSRLRSPGVLASAVGTPLDPSHVRRWFRKACENAGIGTNWSPRELRHTFVSIMSEVPVAGGSPNIFLASLMFEGPDLSATGDRCHAGLTADRRPHAHSQRGSA